MGRLIIQQTSFLGWCAVLHCESECQARLCLQVPATAAMAVQLRNVAKHEEDERAEIKRLVLKANKDLDLAGQADLPKRIRQKAIQVAPIPVVFKEPDEAAGRAAEGRGRGQGGHTGRSAADTAQRGAPRSRRYSAATGRGRGLSQK